MSITLKGSPSSSLWIALLAATAGIVASTLLSSSVLSVFKTRARTNRALRSQLPHTIGEWCALSADEALAGSLWLSLGSFFKDRGYYLWLPRHGGVSAMNPPHDIEVTCNGFAFAPLHRGWGMGSPMFQLSAIGFPNGMLCGARAVDGRDVVIRVLRAGSEGHDHLEVLKYMSRGATSQATPNHAVPLFELFELEDITFGVFPRIGCTMAYAYRFGTENSVGDVIDMVLQCLEALAFLHSIRVAHRDAFLDNFLVQWFPESLAPRQLTISRPRVFLNDFETAVHFAADVPAHARTCVGLPLCPSFARPEQYFRRVPQEVLSRTPYDPFKLDVWQFGTSLSDFKTTVPEIDSVLVSMTEVDPGQRVSAYDALKSLAKVVSLVPPDRLNIAPVVVDFRNDSVPQNVTFGDSEQGDILGNNGALGQVALGGSVRAVRGGIHRHHCRARSWPPASMCGGGSRPRCTSIG